MEGMEYTKCDELVCAKNKKDEVYLKYVPNLFPYLLFIKASSPNKSDAFEH